MSRRLVVTGAVGIVVIAALTIGAVWMGSYGGSEYNPARLDELGFNGIVKVTVGDKLTDKGFLDTPEWEAIVDAIVFDRGPFAEVGVDQMVSQPLPEVAASFALAVDADLKIVSGSTYFVLMGRARFDDQVEQAKWPWRAKVVLESSSQPVAGTDPALVRDLKTITLPEETTIVALEAFAREYAATADERARTGVESAGPRLAMLRSADAAAVEDPADAVAAFLARPVDERQLPEFGDDAPSGLASALAFDEWASWRVIVLYDSARASSSQWVALMIDSVGIVGPAELPKDQTVTEVNALGPAEGGVSAVMLWPQGVPRMAEPLDLRADGVDPVMISVNAFGVDAGGRSTLDAGGAILVDLRGGYVGVKVLDREQAKEAVLAETADDTTSGSEIQEQP
jgi:hypothetical protein